MNSIKICKEINENNPVIAARFMADPYAIEYDGRIYVYGSNDSDSFYALEDGRYPRNEYSNIKSINCISSDDLVNWTDHGVIQVAADKRKGVEGIAAWAGNSWAPAVAYKRFKDEASGEEKTKFFLYFANSANSIGVLTADSPVGPWTDPIGAPMITKEMPGCKDVEWLFDPAVLMDDDGNSYIYFGGGVPEGKPENPKTIRAAKLGADMISIDGEAVMIDAPYAFEDSGINKFGDTYYYSYCTNWSDEAEKAMGKAQIAYMTSKNPLGPFEYQGVIMKNPGQSGNFSGRAWGNNHHCMLKLGRDILMFYHSPQYEIDMGFDFDMSNGGCAYRTTYLDIAKNDDKGVLTVREMTKKGTVKQLKMVDPFDAVPANCFVWGKDITTSYCPCGKSIILKFCENNAFSAVAGVDGTRIRGAEKIRIKAGNNNNACKLRFYMNEIKAESLIAVFDIPANEKMSEIETPVIKGDKSCINDNTDHYQFDLFIEAVGIAENDSLLVKEWQFI